MMIDTSMQITTSKSGKIKLSEEDEKNLKQAMKLNEESEILLRIFKVINLFYEKFS